MVSGTLRRSARNAVQKNVTQDEPTASSNKSISEATRKRQRKGSSIPKSNILNEENTKNVEKEVLNDIKKKKQKTMSSASNSDDDNEDLIHLSQSTPKFQSKKKSCNILKEFQSLDALFENDRVMKEKKKEQELKLKQLRDKKNTTETIKTHDAMEKMMEHMESTMTSLSAEIESDKLNRPMAEHEKFGYIFSPISQPILYVPFQSSAQEKRSGCASIYAAMETKDDNELRALLWSKAIFIRYLMEQPTVLDTDEIFFPSRICSWLFLTMSTHSDSSIIQAAFSSLAVFIAPTHHSPDVLNSSLPTSVICETVSEKFATFRELLITHFSYTIKMDWKPGVYEFLQAFRRFGFQETKRSMSSKVKAMQAQPIQKSSVTVNSTNETPFPTQNMRYVLTYFILCLRSEIVQLYPSDAFGFIMFFLRMQFETALHSDIIELSALCVEELLHIFPNLEWRTEWAPTLVLRIAGEHEGMFQTVNGWLLIARRLPRTTRGTQLTAGISMYVLQHRMENTGQMSPTQNRDTSPRPLSFSIQCDTVVTILTEIVDNMLSTAKAKGKDQAQGKTPRTNNTSLGALCITVGFMDLALQAFLHVLPKKSIQSLLGKFDDLANLNKSTMSAKWHELKTLVSLMYRKYTSNSIRHEFNKESTKKTVLFLS